MKPIDEQSIREPRSRRWATVAETAQYLKLGRFTAYRLIKAGAIPSVRLGARIRVDLGVVDELLASGALGARDKAGD